MDSASIHGIDLRCYRRCCDACERPWLLLTIVVTMTPFCSKLADLIPELSLFGSSDLIRLRRLHLFYNGGVRPQSTPMERSSEVVSLNDFPLEEPSELYVGVYNLGLLGNRFASWRKYLWLRMTERFRKFSAITIRAR
jgi:hypothetical protein